MEPYHVQYRYKILSGTDFYEPNSEPRRNVPGSLPDQTPYQVPYGMVHTEKNRNENPDHVPYQKMPTYQNSYLYGFPERYGRL